MKLNADLSLRASSNIFQLSWEDSPSSGVQRIRLEQDEHSPPVERVTSVVRFAPQSSFSGHVHGGGEEFLVLKGVFSDQHADYPAGYYVRNPRGTGHAPHSVEGCEILVKLWQMSPDDSLQLAVNTYDESLWSKDDMGHDTLLLFDADYESVCMKKWPAGARLRDLEFPGGVEYFVLTGAFSDQEGTYKEGAWLRLPARTKQSIEVIEDCTVMCKTGHLLNPVSYE